MFQVGDLVEVISEKELKRLKKYKNVVHKFGFVSPLEKYCGKKARISRLSESKRFAYLEGIDETFSFDTALLKPVLKVGDKACVRSYDEISRTFCEGTEDPDCCLFVVEAMKKYCAEKMCKVTEEVSESRFKLDNGCDFYYTRFWLYPYHGNEDKEDKYCVQECVKVEKEEPTLYDMIISEIAKHIK